MALHDVPLCQIFALNACNAYGSGLEPAGPSYEDLDYLDEIARITARRCLTH